MKAVEGGWRRKAEKNESDHRNVRGESKVKQSKARKEAAIIQKCERRERIKSSKAKQSKAKKVVRERGKVKAAPIHLLLFSTSIAPYSIIVHIKFDREINIGRDKKF